MTVVTLLKACDITAFINDKIIDAVIEVKIKKTEEFYKVNQYLTTKPVEEVFQKRKYEITLEKAYSGESLRSGFDLKIKTKDKAVTYFDCKITEQENCLLNSKDMVTVYKINCELSDEEEV